MTTTLPPEVQQVFERFVTTEYTSIDARGQPITWPVTPYHNPSKGSIDVTTGLGYPKKARDAQHNGHVSLLFSDPTGSELERPSAVLVQGTADVDDRNLEANRKRYVRESLEKLPATKGLYPPEFVQRFAQWYFARIYVHVRPERVYVWASGDFTKPPQLLDSHLEEVRSRHSEEPTVEPAAPDANHRVWEDSTSTEGSLSATTTAAMSMALIDKAIAQAKTLTPMIRPIKIDGGDYYTLFMHPFDVFQLRQQAATAGTWADIQRAAMEGGKITGNAIFTGALGMWNGVIMHESSRVPNIVTAPNSGAIADFRNPVFAGAQAACMAFGKNSGPGKMSWVEDTFDYGNQLGVSAGMIAGLKKTIFNAEDFAVLKLATYAPNPSTL